VVGIAEATMSALGAIRGRTRSRTLDCRGRRDEPFPQRTNRFAAAAAAGFPKTKDRENDPGHGRVQSGP
jgi:hypothetical protein